MRKSFKQDRIFLRGQLIIDRIISFIYISSESIRTCVFQTLRSTLSPPDQEIQIIFRCLNALWKGFQHMRFNRNTQSMKQRSVTLSIPRQIIECLQTGFRSFFHCFYIRRPIPAFLLECFRQIWNVFLSHQALESRIYPFFHRMNQRQGILIICAIRNVCIYKNIGIECMVDPRKGLRIRRIHFDEITVQIQILRISSETVFCRSILIGSARGRPIEHSPDIVSRNNCNNWQIARFFSFFDPFINPQQTSIYAIRFAGMNGIIDQNHCFRSRFLKSLQ
ncbi:hypothetical protein D3C80_1181820 [compost metagenome]